MRTGITFLMTPRRGLVSELRAFFSACLREVTTGGRAYHVWMGTLTFIMCCGAFAYSVQLREGLAVTGMTDQVSWGFYISNFAFLVGIAAAAVILVMPTYILKDVDFKRAVLIGEAVAVSALVMAICFVVVDVGGPLRLWHLMPGVGLMNWPQSMLAWDIIVLNGYLVLNLLIPFYILFCHFTGREPVKKYYVPAIILSIAWAVSVHLVTAFLFAGLPARPYWNSALLGPRFLATAFAAGPALIILILAAIRHFTDFRIGDAAFRKLGIVVTVAAQITLVMLISELFVEFYRHTHHGASAMYLFFGLDGHNRLVPWIWASVTLSVLATVALSFHPVRRRPVFLYVACAALFVAIEIEKGIGTIIPGFIPDPWGRIVEYSPTWVELTVSAGIWAFGAFLFSVLAKAAIPIELGRTRHDEKQMRLNLETVQTTGEAVAR
jgi:Ni/Fe-hydrogenase subunit HybB-like protein